MGFDNSAMKFLLIMYYPVTFLLSRLATYGQYKNEIHTQCQANQVSFIFTCPSV